MSVFRGPFSRQKRKKGKEKKGGREEEEGEERGEEERGRRSFAARLAIHLPISPNGYFAYRDLF